MSDIIKLPKKWGHGEFWGLGSEYDPDWYLTEKQKKLREDLIDLCRRKIRPKAAEYDKEYIFPRESMDALSELGLLSLIVPEEFGGLGENHICIAMVVETIARYGCPSTAMVYTMHILGVFVMMTRYHKNKHIQDLLRRINKEKLIGTTAASDPATGGHFWFHVSSKTKVVDESTLQILKYVSWCTSAGYADWYTVEAASPDYEGDYSNITLFLIYKDEVRASSDSWSALGMHGNMSGPVVIECKIDKERVIGEIGEAEKLNGELANMFLLQVSACWNGIAMGCMDIAKKHVTRKTHADLGMRVCDYPTIQDYFGESLCETTASRLQTYSTAQHLDEVSEQMDWSLHADPKFLPRTQKALWVYQCKYFSSNMVTRVSDRMMQACGGTGYKTELGLERLVRDSRAGGVMAPSNEYTRNILGKMILCGFDSVDVWEQKPNERVMHNEMKKLSPEQKRELAKKLVEDAENNEKGKSVNSPFQDTDFENPFNTCPPAVNNNVITTPDGINHSPALNKDTWVSLILESTTAVNEKMASFKFSLPNKTDHTGCFAGQYIWVKIHIGDKDHSRYFSPVSRPDDFGHIELVLRFESHGILSQHFKSLQPGDKVEFQGPCGGFEYEPNKLDELTLLASGGGITPGMQMIRCIMNNPEDKTKIKLLYYSDNIDDLLYKEEIDNYAANGQQLQVVYALGETPEDWEGEEGFIDTQMIDKHLTKPNSVKHKIVMCGGSTMTVSCLHSLRSLGFPSHTIFIYGQFGTDLIRIVYGKNVQLSGHRCDNVL